MANEFPFEHFLKKEKVSENNTLAQLNPSQLNEKNGRPHHPEAKISEKPRENNDFSTQELDILREELENQLSNSLPSYQFDTYFKDGLKLKSLNSQQISFEAKTSFVKTVIEKNLIDELNQAIERIMGKTLEVRITVSQKASETTHQEKNTPKSASEMKFSLDLENSYEDMEHQIESDYIKHMNEDTKSAKIDQTKDFNNFIVGASNNLAYASSVAVAQSPGRKYPSLYIHSSSGLGKTHLLHAVANGIREKYPQMRICLVTAREFMKEMIDYVRKKNISEFQKKYTEKIDVLMIDDIHALKQKTGTQDEFFHIFNELYNKNKQLIFTSDKSPEEIDGIEERVKTRLQWGLVVDIQKPDLETRIAILQEKAKQLDLYLSDDILTLIASSIKSSIRELEGSLIKLSAFTGLMNVEVDIETVKDLLKIQNDDSVKKITLDDVAKSASQYFKIPLADLKSKSRSKDIARARHIAMYLGRKIIHSTQQEIGHYFGGRDHSTVISGVRKVEEQLKTDSSLSRDVFEVENRL